MILTKKLVPLLCYFALILLAFTWANYSRSAEPDQNIDGLFVTPERCVAVRQGQTCYQEVTFNWHQSSQGNYCLVELSTMDVLQCWQHVSFGEFELDFQSSESRDFALRGQDKTANLAVTSITVSWVFKSSKRPKSSWKLF